MLTTSNRAESKFIVRFGFANRSSTKKQVNRYLMKVYIVLCYSTIKGEQLNKVELVTTNESTAQVKLIELAKQMESKYEGLTINLTSNELYITDGKERSEFELDAIIEEHKVVEN